MAAKSYHQAQLIEESMASCFDTLSKLGEQPLRDIGDTTLNNDLLKMNRRLRGMSDESILNIQENALKKYETIMKLYSHLGYVVSIVGSYLCCFVVHGDEQKQKLTLIAPYLQLHLLKPSLLGDVSLRMLNHSMSNGLVPSSCGAFLYYGEVLVATGNINEGCRFGAYHTNDM